MLWRAFMTSIEWSIILKAHENAVYLTAQWILCNLGENVYCNCKARSQKFGFLLFYFMLESILITTPSKWKYGLNHGSKCNNCIRNVIRFYNRKPLKNIFLMRYINSIILSSGHTGVISSRDEFPALFIPPFA